uniref:Uncharacterized protein n=1 Tax=Arundo donax TaxID=35708 RepID=A0A0A9GZB4_ARUDO
MNCRSTRMGKALIWPRSSASRGLGCGSRPSG